jgi:uncharacterized protein YycO
MKVSDLQPCDALLYHTEGEFVCEAIQELTDSEYNHVATYMGDGFVAEAIADGYKKRTLQESISEDDKWVDVYRYHGDGIDVPLATWQVGTVLKNVNRYLDVGTKYGYSQIAFLAVLSQLNDQSLEGQLLRQASEELQKMIEDGKQQLICSEADYRVKTEAGLIYRILNDDARKTYYHAGGDILERYKATSGQDLSNPTIADWVTPRDIAESPDNIFIDTLEL